MGVLKKLFAFLAAGTVLAGSAAVPVLAEEMDDTITGKRQGTITVQYADDSDGKEPVVGAEFTLYKAADIVQSGKDGELDSIYKSVIPGLYYSDYEKNGTGKAVTTDTEPAEYIDLVHEHYEGQDMDGYIRTTDLSGTAVFEGLTAGLYVCEETNPAPAHYASEPCLVAIPTTEEDENGNPYWSYEQEIAPKSVPTGELTVKKLVTGNAGEKDREFTFQSGIRVEDDKYKDLEYPYRTSEGNTGTIKASESFKLKAGESMTISMIPAGASYSAVEAEADTDGYKTTWEDREGHIVRNTESEALCTNERNKNEKDSNYQTGDKAVYTAALLAAVLAFLLLVVMKRGKKEES